MSNERTAAGTVNNNFLQDRELLYLLQNTCETEKHKKILVANEVTLNKTSTFCLFPSIFTMKC